MKEQLSDKRAAALKATLNLISEQGLHGTPMSQIAKKANIGVGTIYRYFSSKEDLINALYIEIKTRMAQYTLRNYSKDIPICESFKQLINDVIHYMIENPAEFSFVEQYENSPLITADTHKEAARIAASIEDMFKRALEQGLLKDLPVQILGSLVGGATISLVKFYRSSTVKPDEASLTASIEAVWDMIKR